MMKLEQSDYREMQPAPALAAHVWSVWVHSVSADGGPYAQRSVPNGSAQLVWPVGETGYVLGPRTSWMVDELEPGSVVVGVRVRPGAAHAVFGVPASELLDLEVSADALWGAWGHELGERVAEAGSPSAALAALQAQLIGRLRTEPDPLVAEIVRLLTSDLGSISSLTNALAMSERQLRRRCHTTVGLSPKSLQRLLRFQRFLAAIQSDLSRHRLTWSDELARRAVDSGYADQAHLTRECRRLTGVSPRTFLSEIRRQCGPTHHHAASFAPLLRAAPRS